ncbi:NUT family member 2D-like [Trichechus manatus latirostris]|uniref:NUT family member 2D-like n=1 Tax=Trichechus manatus latirostris TaxID=127582 RepID=A0A2Y9FZF1_TRIMA|nr:NUT family member 2D-like [Trichechus manatus latirostris]
MTISPVEGCQIAVVSAQACGDGFKRRCLITVDADHLVHEANIYLAIINLIIIYRTLNTVAEEELQIQKLQQRNASVCLHPPATWNLDPHGPSSSVVGQHSVFIPKKGGPKAQPPNQHQHRPQCPWEPKRPNEIPPKAVKECVEIMEGLLGPAHSATGEPDGKYEEENEQQQEENGIYPDSGFFCYMDKPCSQEAFITKVEAVIHPQFLEMVLSPESQVDPMSFTQELEEEEGLTPTQVNQRRKGES